MIPKGGRLRPAPPWGSLHTLATEKFEIRVIALSGFFRFCGSRFKTTVSDPSPEQDHVLTVPTVALTALYDQIAPQLCPFYVPGKLRSSQFLFETLVLVWWLKNRIRIQIGSIGISLFLVGVL